MCGVAGFLSSSPLAADAAALARRMGERLRHRGPDGGDDWLDAEAGIALVHRRLAIQDLSPAGHQPMVSADGRWVMSFNGEIYNHPGIRRELDQGGLAPAWRGHSDTETLLAAVTAWGVEAAVSRLVGMFAIALWDRQHRALTLVRDRLGEKPLYYGRQDGMLVFGSELKALSCARSSTPSIDRGALALFLRLGYIPEPWSIHEGIRKLPAGTLLRVSCPAGADSRPVPYWSVSGIAAAARDPLRLDDVEATDELDRLLRQSIAGQQIADVPLGAFLSGGIDSTAVVALMQARSFAPVRTFTIGSADPSRDESAGARAIASHLGTRHTDIVVTPADALRQIPTLPQVYCEPFADSSQIPTLLVCQLARQHVSVCLSGDGGDELFGGYGRYRLARRIASVPPGLRKLGGAAMGVLPDSAWSSVLAAMAPLLSRPQRGAIRRDRLHKLRAVLCAPTDDAVYRQMTGFWPEGRSPALAQAEPPTAFTMPPPAGAALESRLMLLDLRTYLPDDILVKVDRAAMSVSLETRLPLLDHRLVEFALRLPLQMKMRNGRGKWILRNLVSRYVPDELMDRPKRGFGIPIDSWLRGPLRDWAGDLFSAERLRRSDLITPEPVQRIWQDHLAERGDWGHWLWPVLMFEAWRGA